MNAIKYYSASLEIRKQLVARSPADLDLQKRLASAHVSSGRAHEQLGQRDKARQNWRRAVEILVPASAGSEDLYLLDTYTQALLLLGWKEQARPFVKVLLDRGWNDDQFLELVRINGLGRGR